MMVKRDSNKQMAFEFNEQGVDEVSEQIMNSYNSGFIDETTALADSGGSTETETEG